MGNSNGRQSGASSPHHHSTSSSANHSVRTFDGGSLSPHGIYPGRPDYNPIHVLKYIRERRLAPFYKGLDDYEDEWSDYQLSHFVKEGKLPPTPDSPSSVPPPGGNSSSPSLMLPPSVDEQANVHPNPPRVRGMSLVEPNQQTPISSSTNPGVPTNDKGGRPRAQTTGSSTIIPTRGKPLEALVYRSAIECPVCFLVLPLLINALLITVLSTQYKSYTMLLETHLYGMFCRNETFRTTLPFQRRQSNARSTSNKPQPNEPNLRPSSLSILR